MEFQVAAIEEEGEREMKVGRMMFLEEVAEILRKSVKTVRRRVDTGKLKAFKEGGRIMVLEADLEAYLEQQIRSAGRP